MVIIFHISISLFNFTIEKSTEFKWGINARQRINMPHVESFSQTFDQNRHIVLPARNMKQETDTSTSQNNVLALLLFK